MSGARCPTAPSNSIFGLDPQEGVPTYETFCQRVHLNDNDTFCERIQRSISHKSDYVDDHRIVLPDGTVKHIQTIGHPVFDGTGEIVEYVGTAMDVTERKRADEERERLHQLEADLAHMNRVGIMGGLAASLAHEIKQPITAAATNARACLRWLQCDQPDFEEVREASSRMLKDATRAIEIIKRTSSLYKKGTSQRELVDINEVIEEMIVLLRNEGKGSGVSIRSELASNLPRVKGDRVQLQQVLMNLVLNSVDAMKNVSGRRELTLSSQLDGNSQLLVSVSDTGTGLPPEMEQIFDAFFTTKPHGTGMGLAISRTIIESHGGRLWATSNSGGGAIFYFTVPVEAQR
jgi:signal transduction histidine kinase